MSWPDGAKTVMTVSTKVSFTSTDVAEALRSQIRLGILKPGDRLPSYSAMMAEYGMSSVTVERLYNGLEKEGLIFRQHGRGTFVATPARREPTGLVGIAFVAPTPNEPLIYWSELWQGVSEAAERHDVQLVALNQSSSAGFDMVDGVLICNPQPEEVEALLQRVPAGTPFVSALVPRTDMASVVSDDYAATASLVRHLLSLGHTRIAYMTSSTHDPFSTTRGRAYRDVLREAGIEPDPRWFRILQGEPLGYAALTQRILSDWLNEDWHDLGCTAFMAYNDWAAMGALDAFREAGVSVPQEVSVTGFDGLDFGAYLSPRLTTASVPRRQIGDAAMELLLQKIRGGEVSLEATCMPATLVVRSSTAAVSLG